MALRTLTKLEQIVTTLNDQYDQLAEAQAEGETTGYNDEFLGHATLPKQSVTDVCKCLQ